MVGQTTTSSWRRGSVAALLAIAIAYLSAAAGYAAPTNVHDAVYTWSDSHQGEDVPVVVRTSGDASDLAADIVTAGGIVDNELDFVSSVQAQVSRSTLADLAARDDVTWVSLDAPLVFAHGAVDTDKLATSYPFSVKADGVWDQDYDGTGIGVAVIDTGVSPTTHGDFVTSGSSRVVAQVEFNAGTITTKDGYGHGTHIAGIIAGDGTSYNEKYVGIAPRANIINVKIADDLGMSTTGDLIAALAWVNANKSAYNIRVVNLSLHSSVAESYLTSPLDAAVEALWFNGIFVVVASGNTGTAAGSVSFPPSNDPFVMTVGAIDDKGTKSFGDDVPATWGSRGVTQDGFTKPELMTPGANIVSVADTTSLLYLTNITKRVSPHYLKLSGTSMSAGVMSGIAALELEKHPDWTPGQLKCSLISKARTLTNSNSGYKVPRAFDTFNLSTPSGDCDAGIRPSYFLNGLAIIPLIGSVAWVLDQPDVQAAANLVGIDLVAANIVVDPTRIEACGGTPPASTPASTPAATSEPTPADTTAPSPPAEPATPVPPTPAPVTVNLCNVNWAAIQWSAISWSAISWSAISWSAISWSAISWSAISWSAISWSAIQWSAIQWSAIQWSAIQWSAISWSAISWSAIQWSAIQWSAISWSAISWSAIQWSSIEFDSAPDEALDEDSGSGDSDTSNDSAGSDSEGSGAASDTAAEDITEEVIEVEVEFTTEVSQ